MEHFCHSEKLPSVPFPADLSKPSFPSHVLHGGFLWLDTHVGDSWCRRGSRVPTHRGVDGVGESRGSGWSWMGLPWDSGPSGQSALATKAENPSCWLPAPPDQKELMSLSLGARSVPFWNPLNLGSSGSFVLQFCLKITQFRGICGCFSTVRTSVTFSSDKILPTCL